MIWGDLSAFWAGGLALPRPCRAVPSMRAADSLLFRPMLGLFFTTQSDLSSGVGAVACARCARIDKVVTVFRFRSPQASIHSTPLVCPSHLGRAPPPPLKGDGDRAAGDRGGAALARDLHRRGRGGRRDPGLRPRARSKRIGGPCAMQGLHHALF